MPKKGEKRSPEAVAKMMATLLNPDFNKKWRQKMKIGWTDAKKESHRLLNKGKKLSEDHKKKISVAHVGKKISKETREKLRIVNIGKINADNNPMRKPGCVYFFKGENNPNWKGGTSRIYKTGYYSSEYKQWRRDVFSRDNYTCQDCGETGYVTAHHIKSFAHYPDLRFDINNGKTLCQSCHSKTDNYKGRNKNKLITNKN